MKKTLLTASFFALFLLVGCLSLNLAFSNGWKNVSASRLTFFRDMASFDCVKKEAVIFAANNRGFRHVIIDDSTHFQFAPNVTPDTKYVVNVHILPDPLFATSAFTTFPFDAKGCWIFER